MIRYRGWIRLVVCAAVFHDLHRTILHLLGFDGNRLTFPYQGLDQRLIGVEPTRVVKEILA